MRPACAWLRWSDQYRSQFAQFSACAFATKFRAPRPRATRLMARKLPRPRSCHGQAMLARIFSIRPSLPKGSWLFGAKVWRKIARSRTRVQSTLAAQLGCAFFGAAFNRGAKQMLTLALLISAFILLNIVIAIVSAILAPFLSPILFGLVLMFLLMPSWMIAVRLLGSLPQAFTSSTSGQSDDKPQFTSL